MYSAAGEVAMMKPAAVLVLALAAAGCATSGDTQLAAADCKVVPITTASAAGRARNVSPIERRAAEMDLANTEYRRRQLQERGLIDNTVEEALRDCNRR